MTHSDFGKPESGNNPFRALIIGAVAVIAALAVFLYFQEGAGTSRQVGINAAPPPAASPAQQNNPAPAPRSQ
jgi:hypothetical protein